MGNLEKLVPPPELCKQIPEGQFKDSALVWTQGVDGMFIDFRDARPEDEEGNLPAPTLEELAVALYDGYIYDHVYMECEGYFWEVGCKYHRSRGGYIADVAKSDGPNVTADALRFWLELERKKHEQ